MELADYEDEEELGFAWSHSPLGPWRAQPTKAADVAAWSTVGGSFSAALREVQMELADYEDEEEFGFAWSHSPLGPWRAQPTKAADVAAWSTVGSSFSAALRELQLELSDYEDEEDWCLARCPSPLGS